MNKVIILIVGLIVGVAATVAIGGAAMPSMMLEVRQSRLAFDETVTAIETAAINQGWQVPKIYDLQQSLIKAGHENMTRMRILSLCQPDHAYNILSDDKNKMVAAMMPCRIGVFETADGKVYVSQMNIGLMSKLFGGKIEEVMGKVATEEETMLRDLLIH